MSNRPFHFADHTNYERLRELMPGGGFGRQLKDICDAYPENHRGPRLIFAEYSDSRFYIILPKGLLLNLPSEYVLNRRPRVLVATSLSLILPIRTSGILGSLHSLDKLHLKSSTDDNGWTDQGSLILQDPSLHPYLDEDVLVMHFAAGHADREISDLFPPLLPFESMLIPSKPLL